MNSSGSAVKTHHLEHSQRATLGFFVLVCFFFLTKKKNPFGVHAPFSSVRNVSQPSCLRKFITLSAGTKPCLQRMKRHDLKQRHKHCVVGAAGDTKTTLGSKVGL